MGALRWRGDLDFQIERLSGKPLKRFDPEVVTILRLGIYQIRFLERIPKAAIVNEAVELTKGARKRSAAGLVNAVLRKCLPPSRRFGEEPFDELRLEERQSIERAVPAWLFERWSARNWGREGEKSGPQGGDAGVEVARKLAWVSTQVPPTTLRFTGSSADLEALQRELAKEKIRTKPARYARLALVVESRNVQSSKALREAINQGRVVIQDEASQLVAGLLAPEAGQRVLDLCAAPGMKASRLAQDLGRGTLVACDLSAPRLRTLLKLLPRLVPSEVRVRLVRLDATRELPFSLRFDRILLDVPCSGTGTLARNPEIKGRLQPRDLDRFAEAQAKMLRNAFEYLVPGGRLVYATCSLEPEENEQVVEKVLPEARDCRLRSIAELSREFPNLSSLFDGRGYFRSRPDLHFMDGFFAAVITRDR
jgi:16S rRNA (cytosine967-C5)-methyltransferase